jgi:hypothetical protein
MNFSEYIDGKTGVKLKHLAKLRNASRNILVHEALKNLLDRKLATTWPAAVLDFVGVKKVEPFEKHRRLLKSETASLHR